MIPKYFILKHIITGEYHIATITEWGGKYTLDDYNYFFNLIFE